MTVINRRRIWGDVLLRSAKRGVTTLPQKQVIVNEVLQELDPSWIAPPVFNPANPSEIAARDLRIAKVISAGEND